MTIQRNNLGSRRVVSNNIDGYRAAHIPQPTWMFKVMFYFNTAVAKQYSSLHSVLAEETSFNGTVKLNPISCSLPQEEKHTAETWFLGTKRTLTTMKDRSGECTMEFYYRNARDGGKASEDDADYTFPNFFKLVAEGSSITGVTPDNKSVHSELSSPLIQYIDIILLSSTVSESSRYRLYNPIITNVEHSSELNYESDEALKWSMTIHYDWWEVR